MPVLTLIVGYPGAGKTTIVRSMLDATFTGVTDGKIAWVQSKDVVVFGRWKGFHKDTKVAGRLDGTDRIHGSQFKKCMEALAGFVMHVMVRSGSLARGEGDVSWSTAQAWKPTKPHATRCAPSVFIIPHVVATFWADVRRSTADPG